jgi:hypothetical protein
VAALLALAAGLVSACGDECVSGASECVDDGRAIRRCDTTGEEHHTYTVWHETACPGAATCVVDVRDGRPAALCRDPAAERTCALAMPLAGTIEQPRLPLWDACSTGLPGVWFTSLSGALEVRMEFLYLGTAEPPPAGTSAQVSVELILKQEGTERRWGLHEGFCAVTVTESVLFEVDASGNPRYSVSGTGFCSHPLMELTYPLIGETNPVVVGDFSFTTSGACPWPHECPAAVTSRCAGGTVEECAVGGSSCVAVEDCAAAGLTCGGTVEPVCVGPCAPACDAPGAQRCEAGRVETCTRFGACTAWLLAQECGRFGDVCELVEGGASCLPGS